IIDRTASVTELGIKEVGVVTVTDGHVGHGDRHGVSGTRAIRIQAKDLVDTAIGTGARPNDRIAGTVASDGHALIDIKVAIGGKIFRSGGRLSKGNGDAVQASSKSDRIRTRIIIRGDYCLTQRAVADS